MKNRDREIIESLTRIEKKLGIKNGLVQDRDISISDFEESISNYKEFALEELEIQEITIKNQVPAIRGFLNHSKGIINKETVKEYFDSNDSDTWKSTQLKALRRYLRDFLKLGKWIEKFEFKKIKIERKGDLPDNTDLELFWHNLPTNESKIVFLLLYSSGLRENEILSQVYPNIDTDTHMIDARNIHIGNTKNSWLSFMTSQAYDIFDQYLYESDFDYENETKMFSISARTLQQHFVDASENTGVKITPKTLRAIFSEKCREASIDKEYIEAFQGRTSKGVLETHYTSYGSEALRKQYDKVEPFLILDLNSYE